MVLVYLPSSLVYNVLLAIKAPADLSSTVEILYNLN